MMARSIGWPHLQAEFRNLAVALLDSMLVYWILAALCLLIALRVPQLRIAALAGFVALSLLLAWGMLQRVRSPAEQVQVPKRSSGEPVSPAAVVSAFRLDDIATTDLHLVGSGAPFELRGRIGNQSTEMELRSFTVAMTRRDCFPGALDPSGCDLIWSNEQWFAFTLVPGEAREIAATFWARGVVPHERGTIQDSFEIVSATGRPAPRSEGATSGGSLQ